MIIAVDFDGTITDQNDFPYINNLKDHAIAAIKNLQNHGHKIILWTCREGKHLDDAREVLKAYGVELDGFNYSPYQLQSRKIVADVYVDDKNVFMVDDVDWYKIEEYILKLPEKRVLLQPAY